MESNIEVKTPKLNISNIKSPLTDGGNSLGNVGQGGTSKVGTLAKIVRKNRISINSLVKSQEVQDEKIIELKNISQTKNKKQDKGKNNFNTTLLETNKILVEIQKQLEQHFSNLAKEEKEKQQTLKKEKSKKRFGMEEGALESAKKIGSALVKTTSKILSPVKGFFDKILEFLGFLAAGFLTNAVFGWLSKEENQKKLQKFFNILTQNWKLFAKIFATIYALKAITGLVGALKVLKLVFALLTSKPVLIALSALVALKAGEMIGRPIYEAEIERREIIREKLKEEGYSEGQAQEFIEKTPVLGVDGPLMQGVTKPGNPTAIPGDFDSGATRLRFNLGGLVPGSGNKDTVPAMLTPGEFVISKNIVNKYGSSTFENINNDVFNKNVSPEFSFSPNIDGSIINNMRTEKIYNMISNNPKRNRKVNIQTMDLPPITVPMGGEGSTSSPSPAPSVPTISSRNILDSMRNETPGIYGIYV